MNAFQEPLPIVLGPSPFLQATHNLNMFHVSTSSPCHVHVSTTQGIAVESLGMGNPLMVMYLLLAPTPSCSPYPSYNVLKYGWCV